MNIDIINIDIINDDIMLNNYLDEIQPFNLDEVKPFNLEEVQPFNLEEVQELEEVKLSNIDIKPNLKSKVIKRAPKVFVDEKDKDEKYYIKRKKNTLIAAKNRKMKRENEKKNKILLKNLEKSNKELSEEIYDLKKEMEILCKYVQLKHKIF
jgi:hypothetical protein